VSGDALTLYIGSQWEERRIDVERTENERVEVGGAVERLDR
jgi:hypothetical protein